MIQNRLTKLFQSSPKNLLTVYYTAGFPNLNNTLPILQNLEKAGADIVEIGMPYSDPIADGPTIQKSNDQALANGMNLNLLLEQLQDFRSTVQIPVLLMGYINPVLQFGIEKFCKAISEIGIDGLILPDLPMYEYEQFYQKVFEEHNLSNVFLISPQTSEERIRKIDNLTQGFVYMVSSSSTTGKTEGISNNQETYFERIQQMNLKNPTQIGFGISTNEGFQKACSYANGAIIGSAFIKALSKAENLEQSISDFVKEIKGI